MILLVFISFLLKDASAYASVEARTWIGFFCVPMNHFIPKFIFHQYKHYPRFPWDKIPNPSNAVAISFKIQQRLFSDKRRSTNCVKIHKFDLCTFLQLNSNTMLSLSVFSHLGFKSLAHYLMPNPISISAIDQLISHKQIVHETLEKFTDRNF